jgi:ADP-ribose pyrophosphatase YjhB (NUDIX family)
VRRAAEPEKGKWDLPGGFTNYDEDLSDTAARETIEESGLKIAVSRLLGVYIDRYREPKGTYWPTIHIYLAHLLDPIGDPTQVDAAEVSDIAWHELLHPPVDVAFPTQQLGAIDAHLGNR